MNKNHNETRKPNHKTDSLEAYLAFYNRSGSEIQARIGYRYILPQLTSTMTNTAFAIGHANHNLGNTLLMPITLSCICIAWFLLDLVHTYRQGRHCIKIEEHLFEEYDLKIKGWETFKRENAYYKTMLSDWLMVAINCAPHVIWVMYFWLQLS